MLHDFQPSITDANKCRVCHQVGHKCEVCDAEFITKIDNEGNEKQVPIQLELMYNTILMCEPCRDKEINLTAEINKPENVQKRIDDSNNRMDAAIRAARMVDESIQIKTDLFNAATVAIVTLKAEIDNNPTIDNKPYALAEELTRRFTHFQNVIFEANKAIVDAANNQKAIQVYLNTLANQLRAEEREKLKISDINYQPKAVKPVVKKVTTKPKLDKVELRKYASELGISEFTLQMLVVQKGITVEAAANMLRKSVNEAKSESN